VGEEQWREEEVKAESQLMMEEERGLGMGPQLAAVAVLMEAEEAHSAAVVVLQVVEGMFLVEGEKEDTFVVHGKLVLVVVVVQKHRAQEMPLH
jgi:hypothetical protein